MLIGLGLLVSLITVPLAGGRLASLADLRLRGGWLLLTALVAQIVIVSIAPGGSRSVHAAAHVASYVLIGGFVVLNRSVPYLWLIAFGGALNFAAIAANGGVMPADPHALAAAGLEKSPDVFTNSGAVEHPHLRFLGDMMWVPESWPASNVFSVGDVIIVVGAFLTLHTVCRSRLALPRFGAPRSLRDN